jgi:hypothetical protein
MECPPKNSCFEASVPSAMFRDGALGKWLYHEGSDLISELIHGWTRNLMTFGEMLETRRWGLGGGSKSLGGVLGGYMCSSSLSLLPGHCEVSSFPLPCPSVMTYLPSTVLKAMRLVDHALKPLKLWAKINSSFLTLSYQVFCHSNKKLTQPNYSLPSVVYFSYHFIMWFLPKEHKFH